MKKMKLRMWVKVVIISLIVLQIGWILFKTDEEFIKGCMSNGYSRDYCIAHR